MNKKIIFIALAVVIIYLTNTSKVFAELMDDNPAGKVISKMNRTDIHGADCSMNNNFGIIEDCNGIVVNNKGNIGTLRWKVENNLGQIDTVTSTGIITGNSGIVLTNSGTVNTNNDSGTINVN